MAVPIWTPPSPFLVGETPDADRLNTLLVDNMEFLHAAKRVRVYRATSNQTTISGDVALAMNGETYDEWGLHSTSVNPSRITITDDLEGVWRFTAVVTWTTATSGYGQVTLFKNTGAVTYGRMGAISGSDTTAIAVGTMVMAAGDYCDIKVSHSAVTGDVVFGEDTTYLEGEWLGAVAS